MQRRDRSPLSQELRGQLFAITPSVCNLGSHALIHYYPCEVTLRDGSITYRAYVEPSEEYFAVWGVDPEDDPGKQSLDIDEIVSIRESRYRMPASIANDIYQQKESGMGFILFRLLLEDGNVLYALTGGAADFLVFPSGISPQDVCGVMPGWADEPAEGRTPDVKVADYVWCLYANS